MKSNPQLYIIAGPNGAGKTTFAREFLPHYADRKQFVNADVIAKDLASFSPESAALRAGRHLLGQIRLYANKIETIPLAIWRNGKVQWVRAEKLLPLKELRKRTKRSVRR